MSIERERAALAGRPNSQISTTNAETATPPIGDRQAFPSDERRRFTLRGAVEEIGDLVARLRGYIGESVHRGNDAETFLHARQARTALLEAVRAASAMTVREGGEDRR